MPGTEDQFEARKDFSVLFADIEGFSKLKPFQQKLYLREVLQRLADALYKQDHKPERANTWGDGLVAFFSSHTSALRCGLSLRDLFRVTDWEEMGLPRLRIRVAIHAGEVYEGYNPVTKQKELIGTEVNRAARIEPVVAPNHVYVTLDFARRCKDQMVRFHELGDVELAKKWGSETLCVALWSNEQVDATYVRTPRSRGDFEELQSMLQYPHTSKFGGRLTVSTQAKIAIADYCIKNDFWRKDDVVFLESGTLPVYLAFNLFRKVDPISRPRLLVTNNLVCSTLALLAEGGDETGVLFPEDRPMNCVVIGGRLLDDYAATIPEDLLDSKSGGFWRSDRLQEYLTEKGVNHVVMMVSHFTSPDGPCAVSPAMRRFKKLLLRYIAENPRARLSILFEADKLTGRRGWPVDDADLPGDQSVRFWPQVLKSKRVALITAVSPDMSTAEVGLARREMRALKDSGAQCTLLGTDGVAISISD